MNDPIKRETGDVTPAMVVTDCCGRLLPESQTLVGDVHFPEHCPACQWLDGREHDKHVTCDSSQGVECPGPDWTYDAEASEGAGS